MLEAYFSHSWKNEDVPLNIFVWEVISQQCVLYIDHEGENNGAYYINRLEELIRKSDVFVSVLAFREDSTLSSNERPDYQLRCSPASLFELRLAERARKPRWVIYDLRTGFQPMPSEGNLIKYTQIYAKEELARQGSNIQTDGETWLQSISTLQNNSVSRSKQAALLIDYKHEDAQQIAINLQKALGTAGYGKLIKIESGHTDADVVNILQSSSLLVAEIGATSVGDIYGMAHSMFIPSIRFARTSQAIDSLPRVLDGHPGGYQHDLIIAENIDALTAEVRKRAEAMLDNRKPIEGLKAGCAYFRRKLYRPHKVFFSHNLSTNDADLLKGIFDLLEQRGIRAWEYRHNNHAGVVWREELTSALEEATDVVFILDNGFELSEACSKELRTIASRGETIKTITPFLWGTRAQPNPELSPRHHESLPSDKAIAAQIVVDRLVRALLV